MKTTRQTTNRERTNNNSISNLGIVIYKDVKV